MPNDCEKNLNVPVFDTSYHRRAELANKFWLLVIALAIGSTLLLLFPIMPNCMMSSYQANTEESSLVDLIHADNIKKHLVSLQDIAFAHPSGSRSVLNAFNASAQFIMKTLSENTDCQLSVQNFKVPVWNDNDDATMLLKAPYETQLQFNVDFRVMREGGVATSLKDALVQPVANAGCLAEDFAALKPGSVALISLDESRKSCGYFVTARLAEQMKASAVLFYNSITSKSLSNSRIRETNWKEGDVTIDIPVLSISYSMGQFLQLQSNARVDIITHSTMTIADTFNVICDTREGNPDDIVMIGAHLDSVPAGPGMVDDGTGTSAILEVFLKLYSSGMKKNLKSKLRFAWFSAEEIGLMGSRHYCRELVKNQDEMTKIVFYSNHDMLGAPNYVPFIHNGTTAPEKVRTKSEKITALYESYFDGLPESDKFAGTYALDPMGGGSDYFSFLEVSIPAGGLATGAGSLKTMEERTKFGGLANAPYDPCYHKVCDTVENVNFDVLTAMTRSLAHVLEKVAFRENLREWF